MSVCREQYPEAGPVKKSDHCPAVPVISHPPLPGHTITLLPPLTISNLLPVEIHYYFLNTMLTGNLKAGKQALLHGVSSVTFYHKVQCYIFILILFSLSLSIYIYIYIYIFLSLSLFLSVCLSLSLYVSPSLNTTTMLLYNYNNNLTN